MCTYELHASCCQAHKAADAVSALKPQPDFAYAEPPRGVKPACSSILVECYSRAGLTTALLTCLLMAAGKKFYNAPSMIASSGPAVASSMTLSSAIYIRYAKLARLQLSMQSAITLVLRFPGLLKPDNPVHKPILDLIAPDADDEADTVETADVKPVLTQARPSAALKLERQSARSAPRVCHIDLTDDGAQVKRQRV